MVNLITLHLHYLRNVKNNNTVLYITYNINDYLLDDPRYDYIPTGFCFLSWVMVISLIIITIALVLPKKPTFKR